MEKHGFIRPITGTAASHEQTMTLALAHPLLSSAPEIFRQLKVDSAGHREHFVYGCRLQPGSRLGGCVLEEVLEEGALGVVWSAQQDHPARRVVVKVLRRDRVDSNSLYRFQSQAALLASLEHPALVQVYDLGREGHVHYLVREYVEGQRLDKLLGSGGRMPGSLPRWESAVRLVAGLASGLKASHARGILHRAIWSGNVLVDSLGNGRLVDFCMGNDSRPLEIESVRRFLPSERLAGIPADEKTDVYGLGMILLHALSGQLPPVDAALHMDRRLARRILRQGGATLPRGLEAACLDAVEKDPARRIPDAREFSRRLEQVLAGSPDACRSRALGCMLCRLGKILKVGRPAC